MKKSIIFAFLALLAGGNAVLAQPAPGEDEDPPDGPGIVDENGPGMDPAILEDFNENFAPWLQPPGLSIEGLPEPIGFELWKTGGPKLVQTLSNELGAWQAAERAEAEEFSKRTGMPLIWQDLRPGKPFGGIGRISIPMEPPLEHESIGIMIGVENGLPVYLSSLNAGAADTIGSDELWTINSRQRNSLSGLNLNGEGTRMAMWDAGNVLASHQEFTFADDAGVLRSRVWDMGGYRRLPNPGHATHVAGTLVASGGVRLARGMSPHATLLAFDTDHDYSEMSGAFANTNNHLRISNHSYGQHVGWGGSVTNSVDGVDTVYPFWRGELAFSETEDYQFGIYNHYSRGIDDIIYWSRYYLPVWSAGNERGGDGTPAIDPSRGYYAWNSSVNNTNALLITNNMPPPPASDYAVDNGYDLLTPYATAKNNLVVGAVHKIPGGYGSMTTNIVTTTNITTASDGMMITNTVTTTNVIVNTNVVMSAFSSWGPTDDGRIKPDVAAAGVSLFSTFTNIPGGANETYATTSGTSMAAATVAGSLNLLVQLHRRQVGTNQPMLASTLRALAIHTADEAGDHPGPDYRFGWGLFNALSAANLMTNNFHSDSLAHIKEVPLYNIRTVVTNGITNNYTDYIKFPVVARGNEPLKVTLCWNDPPPQTLLSPALDPTNRMLINDLDLRLMSPSSSGSQTNFPWVLNPAIPAARVTKADNDRDNVEQVVVESPATNGVYNVQVRSKGNLTFPLRPVTGSAMAYTNQTVLTNQWVSLLISGNTPQPEPRLRPRLLSPGDGTIALSWPSVVGRVYQVDCRPFVWGGKWEPASGEIAATQTNTAVRLPLLHTNAPSCFYRLRRVR